MFAAAHNCDSVSDNSSTIPSADNKMSVKVKFGRMKIDLKWVVVFPHVDDFNERHEGHHFIPSPRGFDTLQGQTIMFCQRKANEDESLREFCVGTIYKKVYKMGFNTRLPHNVEK
jgi:hypothetical protein